MLSARVRSFLSEVIIVCNTCDSLIRSEGVCELSMNEEKEILRGKITGMTRGRARIVLTDKRLKFGEYREILLSDIREVYTKTESGLVAWSEVAILLKNGEEKTFSIQPEKGIGWEALFETQSETMSKTQMVDKSTQDRWVNLINRLLTAQAAVPKETMPTMILCKYCGARNKPDQLKCANCGAILN